MTSSNLQNIQLLVNASGAPEITLPEQRPLTLTTNFAWVFGVCVATLFTVPALIAWTASIVLR